MGTIGEVGKGELDTRIMKIAIRGHIEGLFSEPHLYKYCSRT